MAKFELIQGGRVTVEPVALDPNFMRRAIWAATPEKFYSDGDTLTEEQERLAAVLNTRNSKRSDEEYTMREGDM